MNLKYIKSLLGILKLLSIILLLIAFSSGLHAYLNSEYNKTCSNSKSSPSTPDDEITSTTTVRSTTDLISEGTTDKGPIIVTLWPTESHNDETTEKPNFKGCENTPILWMERFLIIIAGICIIVSVVLLLFCIINGYVLESPSFRGIDFGYHLLGSILLMISAVFMAYTTTKIDSFSEEACTDPESCQLMDEKFCAAGSSFLTALVFLGICVKSFGRKFYETV